MEEVVNKHAYDELRYERKFHIDALSFPMVEHIVLQNSAGFKLAYPDRAVNNIYFDTHNFQTFVDNVEGIARRTKFRIRWYGSGTGTIKNPVLEYKFKDNFAGYKEKYHLSDFEISTQFNSDSIQRLLQDSAIPKKIRHELSLLRPTLLNNYQRRYYISRDKKFRLTVDQQLQYCKISERNNNLLDIYRDLKSIIVELKYPISLDDDVRMITNQFPFRMTKNSKYVTGIFKLYENIL